MSPRRADDARARLAAGLLGSCLLALAGCATAASVTEATARRNAQQAFEATVAGANWRSDLFATGAMSWTDIGWTASYACVPDGRGALVILVERNGAASYSLAPPAACRQQVGRS